MSNRREFITLLGAGSGVADCRRACAAARQDGADRISGFRDGHRVRRIG